jgi:hypothetical protein
MGPDVPGDRVSLDSAIQEMRCQDAAAARAARPDWVQDDGGRAAAGFKGSASDCVVRAIAIATELSYQHVYDAIHQATLADRPTMARLELSYGVQARRHASPRTGVHKRVYKRWLDQLGWTWTPTMQIGTGCQVHLRAEELPSGRLVVATSRHLTAVIDGVIHDTHDPSRGGTRCVYGVWTPGNAVWPR